MHAMSDKQIEFLRINRQRDAVLDIIRESAISISTSKTLLESGQIVNEKSMLGVVRLNKDKLNSLQMMLPACKFDYILFMTMIKGTIEGKAGLREVNLDERKLLILDCLMGANLTCSDEVDVMFFFVPWRTCIQYMQRKNIHGVLIERDEKNKIILDSLLDMASKNISSANYSFVIDFMVAFLSVIKIVLSPIAKSQMISHGSIQDDIYAYIENNISDIHVNTEMLTSKFKISRSNLYRMFESHGGVKAYIQKRRLTCLYNDILNNKIDRKNLKYIAQRYGFANSGVAKKLFMKQFGFDPRTPPTEKGKKNKLS